MNSAGTGARPRDATLALGLAVGVLILGVLYGARVAGGSDSWGYLSQAELWRAGGLTIEQPFVAEVPWPRAAATFTPLGYAARSSRLVPVYAPGYPLLLALAKTIGGQTGMFYVVPLLGAVLVLATYGIGSRLGGSPVGLTGAWLVATSPAVLSSLMMPMSDVPIAAIWALAYYVSLRDSPRSAVLTGVCSALAVLVRPNLVFVAAALGARYVLPAFMPGRRREALRDSALFALGLAPGVAFVAALNAHLYGSPFSSGYGRLPDLLSWSNLVPNLGQYLGWLSESHTALAVVGLAAALFPLRALWPTARLADRVAMAGMVASVWLFYSLYAVFDAWWYLRFMLSSWPFVMLGTGAVAMWMCRTRGRIIRGLAATALIALGIFQAWVAVDRNVFSLWKGERRYLIAARMVRNTTERNSVVLSMQHSGSIRYYASRMTMRYDEMPPVWIDRAVAFLTERGAHTYLIVEEWELPRFKQAFAGSRAVEAIAQPPLTIFPGPGAMYLFDLSTPTGRRHVPVVYRDLDDGSTPTPGPAPVLALR